MRWILRLLSLVVVMVLAAGLTLFLVPSEKVAGIAAGEFKRLTGRELTFGGAVRPTIWPHLGVRASTVTLANADWSDEGPLLRADQLEIAVDLMALIGGNVRVTGVELVGADLLLETSADGRVNWDLTQPAATEGGGEAAGSPGTTPDTATPFTLDDAVISDGRVVWLDHASGQRVEVTDLDLALAIPDFQGPVEVTGSGSLNGQAVALESTIGAFAPFLDGKVVPLTLVVRAGDNAFEFDGRLGTANLAAEGALAAELNAPGAVLALAGVTNPGLPRGLGRDSIAVAGQVTLTGEGSIHLRDGQIEMDGNRLTGAFDLVPGADRPKLTAQLVAGALDLSGLAGGNGSAGSSGGSSGEGTAPAGWSRAPIDASALGAMDAELTLSAESVDFGFLAAGRTRLGIVNEAARAVIDLRELAAYGGSVTGQVIVNARDGLSSRVNLALQDLALQPLLTEFAGYERLTGTGDIRFNLLGSGGSLDTLMRSLSGEGSVSFTNGAILGLDLVGMLTNLDPNFVGEGAQTVFDGVTASFTMEGGVLRNDDLAFTAPLLRAEGAGTVDVGGQSLNYRVTPVSLGGQDLGVDAQVPVLITGPWAAPSFRLDLESIARRKLEEEARKLEERARTEIEQRLQEELGVTAAPGESLEDTARRAAEEALQREAERALNRLLGVGE